MTVDWTDADDPGWVRRQHASEAGLAAYSNPVPDALDAPLVIRRRPVVFVADEPR